MVLYLEEWFSTDRNGYLPKIQWRETFLTRKNGSQLSQQKASKERTNLTERIQKQTEYFWVFEIPNLHDTYSSAEYEPSYSTHSARDSWGLSDGGYWLAPGPTISANQTRASIRTDLAFAWKLGASQQTWSTCCLIRNHKTGLINSWLVRHQGLTKPEAL